MKKWEIFFSFAYLSAVWLQFGQNPTEKTCLQWFQLDFPQIVTKQLISKQNKKFFSFLQILNIVSFSNFLHSWWGQILHACHINKIYWQKSWLFFLDHGALEIAVFSSFFFSYLIIRLEEWGQNYNNFLHAKISAPGVMSDEYLFYF